MLILCHFNGKAEKIDDTHYRFPFYANFEIEDINAQQYDSKNGYELLWDESTNWHFTSGGSYFDQPLGSGGFPVNVFYRGIRPVTGATLVHSFKYKKNGYTYSGSTTFYIDVVAPSDVSISCSETMTKGEYQYIEFGLEGIDDIPPYPSYPKTSYFPDLYLSYESSNSSVIHLSGEEKVGIGAVPAGSYPRPRVRAEQAGTANIIATLYYKLSSGSTITISSTSRSITVKNNSQPESVTLNNSELQLGYDETYDLKATIVPSDAPQSVTWSSSDSSVASVSSTGRVKGLKDGNATITATAPNGVTGTCSVTVSNSYVIGGIRYKIFPQNKYAHVIPNNTKYKGAIVIPEYVRVGDLYPVTKIGDKAFYECTEMTSITLPNSITTIGEYTFAGCSGLSSFTMPSSVTNVGGYAFMECRIKKVFITNLEKWCKIQFLVDARANPLWVGQADLYLNEEKVVDLEIPAGTKLGFAAFGCCGSIETVRFPVDFKGFTSGRQFQGCKNLKTVFLPDVNKVAAHSFAYCPALKNVYCVANTPPKMDNGWNDETFNEYYAFNNSKPENVILHVPKGSKEAYEAALGWKNFGTIIDDYNEAKTENIETNRVIPTEVYNLNGIRLGESTDNLPPGVYIIRQGSDIKKIIVK